ncbi:MAG: DUF4238 domain-containing protein [Sphingomonas sp.]|uniref:DUF4238 domain-containing protein n=1 Tax=Sphingomonas sp. TaxID=28214 RepID=UPI002626349A|nr:DUF4238 domain-containing protein [Sphingomonas sp.]MDK2770090.1 DUF4238 domain-containing protein [Sphingomonas sp.]
MPEPLPFKPVYPALSHDAVSKALAGAPADLIDALALIYDEAVHRIIVQMFEFGRPDDTPLDIDLREDMTLEIAKLTFWLGERVVEKRLSSGAWDAIDLAAEREAVLGPAGAEIIANTARMSFDHIWGRLIEERYKPKSIAAAKRKANPRRQVLAVKPVGKNHFIPRWFIRDLWAVDGKVLRWRRDGETWISARRGFGEWGYRHNLYSDRLEAWFGLLEGDAKKPVEMLLDTRPLNGPQREAFVGFLIIQLLRNPTFIEAHNQHLAPVIDSLDPSEGEWTPERSYEAMFQNNDLYRLLATPVMESRWAIVKSAEPLFILPDTFGVRAPGNDGLRLIAPLSPKACFVTLPDREETKRIVPRHLPASPALARRIATALIQAADREFLSHPDFTLAELPAPEPASAILADIAAAIAARGDD